MDDEARRGVSRVVHGVTEAGLQAHRVTGWRAESIAMTLDFCARIQGYALVEWLPGQVFDHSGSRLYSHPGEYKLAWARRNREKSLANSNVQWRRSDARMREDYRECVALFTSIYPGQRCCGYDTWRRSFRGKWLADRATCLGAMHSWTVDADKHLRRSVA